MDYNSPDEAANAIATLNDQELEGRKLLVREDREGPEGPAPRAAAAANGAPAGPRPTRGRGGARGRGGRGGHAGAVHSPVEGGASSRPAAAPGTSVYVGNLPWSATWRELKDAFGTYQPGYADVKQDRDGRSKGWGIVRFETPEIAQQAIAEMNGTEMNGRAITVRLDRD